MKEAEIKYCSRFTLDGDFKKNVVIYAYKILGDNDEV